LSQRVAEV
jgi:DNA repair exonuclease SbcCD ATPase subunit